MEGPLVNAVVDDETCKEDGVQNLMQEETEDYFEDPTSILCKYWILVAQYIYTGKRKKHHPLSFLDIGIFPPSIPSGCVCGVFLEDGLGVRDTNNTHAHPVC